MNGASTVALVAAVTSSGVFAGWINFYLELSFIWCFLLSHSSNPSFRIEGMTMFLIRFICKVSLGASLMPWFLPLYMLLNHYSPANGVISIFMAFMYVWIASRRFVADCPSKISRPMCVINGISWGYLAYSGRSPLVSRWPVSPADF